MWARMPVALIGGVITVAATRAAREWAEPPGGYIWAGAIFLVFAAATLFVAFFHRKTGDVLIDTENEMRKVVWPTREEVAGSTAVVIVTVVLLGMSVYMVDVALGKLLILVKLY